MITDRVFFFSTKAPHREKYSSIQCVLIDWGELKIAVVVLNLWVMLCVLFSLVSKLFVLFVDGLKVVCLVDWRSQSCLSCWSMVSKLFAMLFDGLKHQILVDPWCQRARDGRRRLREAGPVS